MKKLLGIIILGLLWCNVGFALPEVQAIRDGKVKIGMTQKELKKAIFWGTTSKHDPFWKGCSRKYFSDSKHEILIPRSQAVFFIFKNVTKPGKIKSLKCKAGNGTLQGFTYNMDDALALIEGKKSTIKKSTIKKSAIEEFKEICTDLGLTHGTSEYVDCVLKLKSDEEKMIMESQRLESEEGIAEDKQEFEEEKYTVEQKEKKKEETRKKYDKCRERAKEDGLSSVSCELILLFD